jgi:hypothetical protein
LSIERSRHCNDINLELYQHKYTRAKGNEAERVQDRICYKSEGTYT